MRSLPHTRSCFVCGEANPSGLRLRMFTDGEVVSATWRPDGRHVGFQTTVHGGLISTVLDEIMVWVCAVRTRRFAYCGELKVRFRKPLTPGVEVRLRAELVRDVRGRIFQASASVSGLGGELLAEAEGKYMPIDAGILPSMLEDIVGDLKEFVDVGGA